jgi:transposase
MAIVRFRNPTEGRAYYDRKVAAGKTPMEAMRSLKGRLSDIVYNQMISDARTARTDPEGHSGNDSAIQRDRPDPGSRLFG